MHHMMLVQVKGKHKILLKPFYEQAESLYENPKEYEQQLYIISEHNNYSKIDHEANRPIQVEGTFDFLKQSLRFRHFLH